jgi:hypothetical protein
MSTKILLVKYELIESDKLIENNVVVIESAFITSEILEKISTFKTKRNVYEVIDENLNNEPFEIECFDDKDLNDILFKLEIEFIDLLKSKGNVENLDDLLIGQNLRDAIFEFKTITNLIDLFRLKNDKYQNDQSTLVKLG